MKQHLTDPDQYLIQIWVGVLGIGFELGGGKLPPPQPPPLLSKTRKNYARNLNCDTQVHAYLVSKNTSFGIKALLILLMSGFFCKKSVFLGQNSTFTQSSSVRTVLEIFSSVSIFCKIKGYY